MAYFFKYIMSALIDSFCLCVQSTLEEPFRSANMSIFCEITTQIQESGLPEKHNDPEYDYGL
jgi:hypothetical protein